MVKYSMNELVGVTDWLRPLFYLWCDFRWIFRYISGKIQDMASCNRKRTRGTWVTSQGRDIFNRFYRNSSCHRSIGPSCWNSQMASLCPVILHRIYLQFLSRVSTLTRHIDIAFRLSVCLSVCPSVYHVTVFYINNLMYCHSFFTTQ